MSEKGKDAVALLLLPLLASAQRALLCALNEKTPAARGRQGMWSAMADAYLTKRFAASEPASLTKAGRESSKCFHASATLRKLTNFPS